MTPKEFTEVCHFLSQTPDYLSLMTGPLSDEQLRRQPADRGFSILEHVCHLRDIEEQGYGARIEKILNEDAPFLPDLDGDRLAREREYHKQNLTHELKVFSECRAENISAVRKISPADLERTGRLENVGTVTLGKLLLIMFEHDEEHLRSLCALCSKTNED